MLRRIVVAAAAGLLAAVVTVPAQAGGGGHCPNPTSDRRGSEVTLSLNCFVPGILRVPSGTDVTFTNTDGAPHTVTGLGFSWGDERDLLKGDAVTLRFQKDGVFPYACLLHPGMIGAVVVGDGNAAGYKGAGGGSAPVELMGATEAIAEIEPEPEAETQDAVPVAADESGGGGAGLALVAGGVLIGAGATGAVLMRRRRRSATASTSPSSA